MIRILSYIIVLLLIPSLGLAEVVLLKKGVGLEQERIDVRTKKTQIICGRIQLNYFKEEIDQIILEKNQEFDTSVVSFWESIVEAAHESPQAIIESYLKIHHDSQKAWDLISLKDSLANDYFHQLSAKVESGIDERVLLQMHQQLRPDSVIVKDIRIKENQVKVIVEGRSTLGLQYGEIDLINEEGAWRIAHESWFSGKQKEIEENAALVESLRSNLLTQISNVPREEKYFNRFKRQQYSFNRNFLSLKHVNFPVQKRSFMFLFIKERKDKKIIKSEEELFGGRKKGNIHILWTGPSLFVPQQKKIKTKYPVDVSIADDGDGYSSGDLNIRLPKKRPNGVMGAFVYNF